MFLGFAYNLREGLFIEHTYKLFESYFIVPLGTKFMESNNIALPIMCHRYAAHFRLSVLLLPYYQCYAPKKQPRVLGV